ncbi:MAG: RNA polymerase factor sigma-54 [Gammaproteobacteria bacterium]
MAKLGLQLKLGQQLTITPQLQQAIRLLQLPVLELNTQIQEALEANVMLEQDEAVEAEGPEPEASVVANGELEQSSWDDLYPETRRADPWSTDDLRQAELPDVSQDSLKDHLFWQLETEHFSPRESIIGQAIIDAINEDGYLTEDLDVIHKALQGEADFSLAEVEITLAKIQTLDPVGVGARELSECLRLQLEQLDPETDGRDLAISIAATELDMVADQEYAMLRRRLSISDADLDTALHLIRSCHPKPGNAIQSTAAEYVVPDVYVRQQDGRWVVDINRSTTPRLQVNQSYAAILRGNGAHENLRAQLQEARWLVRSLEIRNETLLKVAMCIVERQVDFFERGDEAMKPMILKDVAELVEMHESTISRVTSNKYMHTPRGIIDFRHFFSSQLSATDGSEQSSTAIKARIKRLVGQENPQKPISDSKLTALLENEGIKVARRTVAKYRESINIPSTSERRVRPTR